jgi:hypothetical protein
MPDFLTSERRARPGCLAALVIASAAFAGPAASVTVQGATYGELATAQVGRVPHSRTTHKPTAIAISITRTRGSATSTEMISPMPEPKLTTYSAVTGHGSASGETSMSYYFQVVGPRAVSGSLGGKSMKTSSMAKAEIITNLGAFVYPIDDACPGNGGSATPYCGSYVIPVTEEVTASTRQETAGPNVAELIAATSASKAGTVSGSSSLTL